jgi:AcrR family transcriptional regulator
MSSEPSDYGDPQTRNRILTASWELIVDRGSNLKLAEVAERAGVSRQALYLHFGDRTGLLLALIRHMDETLDLGKSLTHVHSAPDAAELLKRAMHLNAQFWSAVRPVAQVLEAAQYDDEALGKAWRDRMAFRQKTFSAMIKQIAEGGELDAGWTLQDASALLYAVASFDNWRELTQHLGWTEDHYVEAVTRSLRRTFLNRQ